jgi:hypothetical protein
MLPQSMDSPTVCQPLAEFRVLVQGRREPLWAVLYPDDIVLVYHGDVTQGKAAGYPRTMRCLFACLWRRRANSTGTLSVDKCLIRGIGEIDSLVFSALDAALRKHEKERGAC